CAQEVPAHHRKVRALVCRPLDRRKSPGNVHVIPTHEKTATNRCIRLNHARQSIFFPLHTPALQKTPGAEEKISPNRSLFDSRGPAQGSSFFCCLFLQGVPAASARSLRASFYRS